MPRCAAVVRIAAVLLAGVLAAVAADTNQVTVDSGKLQGITNCDQTVRIFRGVPFAAAPVGDLRWKGPQPAASWTGVRQADKFGSACLQTDVFGDIYFRDAQPSEDCLNLNVWVPAKSASAKLPVFLWYYGGGFVAGANSEPRYDGENWPRKALSSSSLIIVSECLDSLLIPS
jgi:para-nitrobenzyl esterase